MTEKEPKITDKNWVDFVLSHFDDDEMVEGCPTVDGLRRVAELLLGPILEGRAHVVEAANLLNNGGRATAEYTVTFAWTRDALGKDDRRTFTDAADVSDANCDPAYARFAAAMAATRAEGRAYRKALKLKRVVAVEEITSVPVNHETNEGFIDRSQRTFIEVLCKRNDINVLAFVNSGKRQYAEITEVEHRTAQLMVKTLSDYQRNAKPIPAAIKGYDPNWEVRSTHEG
jgi:hypothetical protein